MGKDKSDEKKEAIGETEPAPKPDSWKIKGWQSLSPLLLLLITCFLMYRSNEIAGRSNEIVETTSENMARLMEETRRYEVQPILRLSATRWVAPGRKDHAIVIRIKNVGYGSALDINVILKESVNGYCRELIHSYYPTGVFPIFDPMSSFITNVPVEPAPDTKLIRDFMLPSEELEFQYSTTAGTPTTFTIFLSYFDIDGAEYLTTTSLVPSGIPIKVMLNGADRLFDSLDQIELPGLSKYKTLVNPGLREPGSFFGEEDHWYDSVNAGQ